MYGVVKGIPSAFETLQIKALYAGDAIKAGFNNIKLGATMAANSIKSVASSVLTFAKTAAINGANGVKTFVVGLGQMAMAGIRTVITAMTPMITSVWAFTAALLANPITWIVVGIVALIAVIILLIKNWNTITAKFPIVGVIFNNIKNIGIAAFNGIKTVVMAVFGVLGKVFMAYVNIIKLEISIIILVFKTTFGIVKTIVVGVIDFIGGAFGKVGKVIGLVFEGVANTFKGVANTIVKGLNFLIGGVNKFEVKVPDWVPLIGGKKFGFNIPQIPMYAKGTNYHPGGLAIVGEMGRELVELPEGSRVIPNKRTEQLLNREVKKVSFKEIIRNNETTHKGTDSSGGSKGNIIIQKVEINAQDRKLSDVLDELFAIAEMA